MPRKRKSKAVAGSAKKKNNTKKTKRKTKKQLQIESLIVGSEWRVNTNDPTTTSTGKEVSSGWQRCFIVERVHAKDDRWGGSVRVEYADDMDDDDPIEYTVREFLVNAAPAPVHVRPVADDVASSVILEQSVFVPKEREELIPLQRKRISQPKTWKKYARKFQQWGMKDETGVNSVPKCNTPKCELQCAELTPAIVDNARNLFQSSAKRGVDAQFDWFAMYIRPRTAKKVTDSNIWSNYVQRHVRPGRKNWSCTFCKCNPDPVPQECSEDKTHKFKSPPKRPRGSRFASCPDFEAGAAFRERVIWDVRQSAKMHTYHVPSLTPSAEYTVHRGVFQQVFNIGRSRLKKTQVKRFLPHVDGRSGSAGRKPHTHLRMMIESFWLNDVDQEPTHYDSTSNTQICTSVSSAAHGYLTFMAKYFQDKYLECVEKQYFPGLSKRMPSSMLPTTEVPKLSCADCIARSSSKGLTQTVCSHIPKYGFFKSVTSTFKLVFKRPGTDQCEKCNSLHDKMVLLRAMGRLDEADDIEERLQRHSEDLLNHHTKAAAFRSIMSELQHSAKSGGGRSLPKYAYYQEIEFSSKDIIMSISMDAGSGLRTPFCRVGFAYFSRVLVTNVYHIVDHGTTDKQPYHVYMWNDKAGGKGPEEVMSIFLDFIKANKTGAKRLVIECDGCGGQVFNQYFFAMCSSLVDPTSDLCRKIGAAPGRPIFERIDIFRGEVGHTFMAPDRVHGVIRRVFRGKQWIASIDQYVDIVRQCDLGRFKVTHITAGDGFFVDMKSYLCQSYKLGGAHADIDGNPIATRARHWVNFGAGPAGGDNSMPTVHNYGAWRLRNGYDETEVPTEIVLGRHTRPSRGTGEYILTHASLGDYEQATNGFVCYSDASWSAKWDHEREIAPEKVRDTHKLACLGLPDDKISLWPCPDPTQCKHDRCPFRIHHERTINVVDV